VSKVRRTAWVLAAAWLCAAWPMVWAAEPAPQPCRVPGLRNEVLCGQVKRPLDPAKPDGVHIDIHYVVVPAMARRKLPDPVFLLAGGPGQSAIDVAPSVLPLFARLNNRRDVVFVDQRGTGRSAPLECEDTRAQSVASQSDPQQQFAELMTCRDALQKLPYGDLRFFTTPIAMQDLDAVRRQLGAERINLVGASYGTRAALDYQRQFPAAVRRSVLDGVAPPDMVLPESSLADGRAALDAMFKACEFDADCARRYPRLRAEWDALRNGLPRPVTVTNPLSGRTESFTLTRDMLMGAVRGPLYAPAIASALPFAVHEAAQGRVQAILTLGSALSSRKGGALAMGMHFSVVCAEDAPRMKQAVPGADLGGDSDRLYQRACAAWPRGEVQAAFYALPPARSPVLLFSGGLDPATPPRHAARVAQLLGAQARHVVVPNAGHGVMSLGCMADVVQRFIDAPDDAAALAVKTDCAKDVPRPPAFEPMAPRAEVSR
jgi:pimeloyl-ACP methyl ester carboxylesterase